LPDSLRRNGGGFYFFEKILKNRRRAQKGIFKKFFGTPYDGHPAQTGQEPARQSGLTVQASRLNSPVLARFME